MALLLGSGRLQRQASGVASSRSSHEAPTLLQATHGEPPLPRSADQAVDTERPTTRQRAARLELALLNELGDDWDSGEGAVGVPREAADGEEERNDDADRRDHNFWVEEYGHDARRLQISHLHR